jgi:GNAT superfamily N-acetyltransferase
MSISNISKSTPYRLSQVTPEEIRAHLICEVGEKAQHKIYNQLIDLNESYPGFDEWFYKTVFPELSVCPEQREIIIIISTRDKKKILSGIAILKKTAEERKICTIRIHEQFRGMGIGTMLFEECFKFLETRLPIITISDKREADFIKHIKKFNFTKTQSLQDLYKPGSIEFVYNGEMSI